MVKPKNKADIFVDTETGEINDDPINISREVDELIERWGPKAVKEAGLHARFFEMAGLDDKAADWAEVKRLVEERFNSAIDGH